MVLFPKKDAFLHAQTEILRLDGQSYAAVTFKSPANFGPYGYRLETSPDLATWETIEPIVSEVPIPESHLVLRTLMDPNPVNTEEKRFFRMSATSQ